MRILFGIQGTGNGHISRATQVIHRLKKHDARVDVVFSGCDSQKVFDQSIIDTFLFCKGFSFSTQNGRIDLFKTIRNLSLLEFARDVLSFNASGYDLVITDFEPVTAMIARKNKIPSIGIGHQYAFLHDIPMAPAGRIDRGLIKYFAPADYSVGMHWHHFNRPIVPPVINAGVRRPEKQDESLILVYLPFEDHRSIKSLLQPFTSYNFAVYAGYRADGPEQEGHIRWHGFSRTSFYRDLADCAGVICSAGFELPSEALFLGKKVLVKPLKGQFEQVSNAMVLARLKLGTVMDFLDRQTLKNWLDAPVAVEKAHYPDVAGHIARWIVNGDWKQTDHLVRATWN